MIINSGNCTISVDNQLQQVSCFGLADGVAEIIASNVLAPVSFDWSHDTLLNQSSVGALNPGSYEVTITDAAGCQEVTSFEITEPDMLVTLLIVTPESSPSSGDASITASTTGGNMPYTYSWSNDSSGTVLTDLTSGQYSVTTSDSRGCIFVSDTLVTGIDCDLEIDLVTNHLSCYESNDGSIQVVYSGGFAPVTFNWSQDSTLTDSFATDLQVGHYTVIVRDAAGCISTAMTDLGAPQPLTLEIGITEPSSSTLADGHLTVSVSGGTLPYQWDWSTGDTTAIITNLDTGRYALTVTDHHRCTQANSVTLEVLDCDLVAELELDSVSCAGKNDGASDCKHCHRCNAL